MKVNSLFAHPIGELMLDIDNTKLVSNVVSTPSRYEGI